MLIPHVDYVKRRNKAVAEALKLARRLPLYQFALELSINDSVSYCEMVYGETRALTRLDFVHYAGDKLRYNNAQPRFFLGDTLHE